MQENLHTQPQPQGNNLVNFAASDDYAKKKFAEDLLEVLNIRRDILNMENDLTAKLGTICEDNGMLKSALRKAVDAMATNETLKDEYVAVGEYISKLEEVSQ